MTDVAITVPAWRRPQSPRGYVPAPRWPHDVHADRDAHRRLERASARLADERAQLKAQGAARRVTEAALRRDAYTALRQAAAAEAWEVGPSLRRELRAGRELER